MTNRWKLDREDCILVGIDFQDRMIQGMDQAEKMMEYSQHLFRGAQIYQVPILLTTQYKKGLGEVTDSILQYTPGKESLDKNAFSIMGEKTIEQALKETGKTQVIITGMESHICVLASVRDLIDAGYQVFVARDCISSRDPMRHRNGIDQMREYGAVISNSESLLFEIAKVSGTPEFKEMQQLIK